MAAAANPAPRAGSPLAPLLEARALQKTYPSGLRALDGVDLAVHEGELVAVVGLSGAGKSTLVRCLNRLVEPTDGEVRFEGEDVTHVRGPALRRLRTRVAMIFQGFNLVRRASVLVNVLTGALERQATLPSLLGLWPRAERDEALRNLEVVGLADRAHQRADTLSGGEQQRVAIARALMQRPRAILADEPVASLDPETAHVVLDALRHLQSERRIAVVANLHFLSLAREYATRVVALRAGRIVFEGPPGRLDDAAYHRVYGETARAVEMR